MTVQVKIMPDFTVLTPRITFIGIKPGKYQGLALLLILFFVTFAMQLSAQHKVSGTVRGTGGVLLPGASITNKGSGAGVMSSADGRFAIMVSTGQVLEVSFQGYQTQRIKVNSSDTIWNISLTENITDLDQVVVNGYSSQKLKEITGSVALVKPRELTAVPAGTTEQMLQGRAAGLTVITSGEPGAPASVRIHGLGNFGDVRPLYIIDGIQGDINTINPYDIETLQVLKDASAFSIYGVRGANGVIVVTTKKGRQGKLKISYDMYVGWQQPIENVDLLNPQEWADLTWKAYRNSGLLLNGNPNHPLYGNGPEPVLPDYLYAGPYSDTLYEGSPLVDPALYNLDPDSGPIYQIVRFNKTGTNWYDEMYKPAFSQSHTVSLAGGTDKNKYLVSVGYLDQEGTMLNTYLKRFTARINTEFNSIKQFTFGENLQLSYTDNARPEKFFPGTLVGNNSDATGAILTPPLQPVYDIFGAWNPGSNQANASPDNNSVARRTLAKDNKSKQWQIQGNIYAELDFLKNFTIRSSFGGTLVNYFNYLFIPGSYDNTSQLNSFNESAGYVSSWTWTNMLTYAKSFGEHRVKIVAGTEIINSYKRETGGTAYDLPFTYPNYWLLNNGDPNASARSSYSLAGISALSSFVSRADYGYMDKYFLTATLRRDGASYFGPENRFGWFPSLGLAWRLTQEQFMTHSDWIDELKLRASWGITGFYGNTDPYNQYTLYGGTIRDAFYDINGNSSGNITRGFRTIRIGNPKTGWQEDVVTNIGLDGIFWKGKLSIAADWYIKKTEGLLFPVRLPALLGDAQPPNVNVGNIENKGIDLTIGSKGNLSRNLVWDLLLTFSHYSNKITGLSTLGYFDDNGGKIRNEVGHPVGSFFGYRVIGLFQDDDDVANSPTQLDAAPGRFKFADTNGRDATGKLTGKPDGQISDVDRTHIGSPHPDFTLGLNIGLSYKNFDFSTYFYGSFGNTVANDLTLALDLAPYGWGVGSKTALYDSWSPDNKDAKAPIPEAFFNFSNGGGDWNSYPLESGTYLRNKSIIFGYTLPADVMNKIKIDRLRVYLQLVNLFTITSYTGQDPELYKDPVDPRSTAITNSAFGIDFGNYPNNQKQFLIGLNISF